MSNQTQDILDRPEIATLHSGSIYMPVGDNLMLISPDLADQLFNREYSRIVMAMGASARGLQAAPPMTITDDNLAIISMIGPVLRYDSWIAQILAFYFGGSVTTDSLMDQYQAALDQGCRGVMLNVDSPGGDAAAIHDFADMIYQARDIMPTVAYVDNLSASAGYWPTTGANKIVVSPASFLGSIGVVSTMRKGGDDSTVEIVSSKSPNKRPKAGDPEGRAVIQARIDDLADVFIGAVAKHRGVTPAKVESDFGQGGVLIGAKAVAAGMADQVGDSNDAFNALRELADRSTADQNKYGRYGPTSAITKGANMAGQQGAETPVFTTMEQLRAACPSLVAQLEATFRAEGAETERARIKAIDAIDNPKNRAIAGEVITIAKWDGKTSHESLAYQIMTAETAKTAQIGKNREEDAKLIPAIKDAPQNATEQQADKAEAEMLASFMNARHGAAPKGGK